MDGFQYTEECSRIAEKASTPRATMKTRWEVVSKALRQQLAKRMAAHKVHTAYAEGLDLFIYEVFPNPPFFRWVDGYGNSGRRVALRGGWRRWQEVDPNY